MGGSSRRLKKHAPKVKVGLIKRSKKLKAPVPELLVSHCPALKDKLGTDTCWATEITARTNYEKNGFVNEPNSLENVKCPVQAADDDEGKYQEADIDLHLALGKQHPEGTRPPAPLTANQRRIMERLIAKHGSDVESMARDSKCNKMLHSAGKLKRMLQAYAMHKEGARVKWQQPKHKLW